MNWTGIVVGGLLPALLYGITGVLMKASTQHSIGLGLYMICAGIGVTGIGLAYFCLFQDKAANVQSICYAIAMGTTWGLGTLLATIGLSHFGMPVSKLVPLYNMNTLIAVLLGLWIFAEWQHVSLVELITGAVLIVVGGTLVANA